jgi:uncharacterized membrane protein HdeD (DUF308 family)
MVKAYQPHAAVRLVPGIILILLGVYSLVRYMAAP